MQTATSHPPDGLPDFADAHWFPQNFDIATAEFRFVHTDRSALAARPFLDARWEPVNVASKRAPATTVSRALPLERPRLHFIWHTGFCCSTLLAKALDFPSKNLSLCEPGVLVDVADTHRTRNANSLAPALAFQLLSRGFVPNEQVTVKPAPGANVLLRDATRQTSGAMLFLYSDCRSFLISIAKLGEVGRKYVRELFLTVLNDGLLRPLPPRELVVMSDLEMAAVLWHMQIAEFRRNWQHHWASLDCDAFLAAPLAALAALNEHFSLAIGADELAERVSGPLFRRHAKLGADSFDAETRRREHKETAQRLGAELDRIVMQSYDIFPATPRGVPLPHPLIPGC